MRKSWWPLQKLEGKYSIWHCSRLRTMNSLGHWFLADCALIHRQLLHRVVSSIVIYIREGRTGEQCADRGSWFDYRSTQREPCNGTLSQRWGHQSRWWRLLWLPRRRSTFCIAHWMETKCKSLSFFYIISSIELGPIRRSLRKNKREKLIVAFIECHAVCYYWTLFSL